MLLVKVLLGKINYSCIGVSSHRAKLYFVRNG